MLVPKGSWRSIEAGPEGLRYVSVHLRRGGLQIEPAAACIPMLHLNLASNPNDPRLTRGTQLAHDAMHRRTRAAGTIRIPRAKP